MISENVKTVLNELKSGNPYGERITVVAATKTRTPEEINEAIAAGITDIGENRVQEFTEKYELVHGAKRHFIGHLQTNKVKYLLGKTDLIHSLDRFELAQEIQKRAEKINITVDALVEINLGNELSKSGFLLKEAEIAFQKMSDFANIRPRGFMAMLPISEDYEFLRSLCLSMREIYDKIREQNRCVNVLSMGMSGDYRLCVECGSNMVRLGTHIFGPRTYK